MGTFKGKRIIPKHDGVWNQKKEYEELTIVLDAESGDGYISRKPVPAGTVLTDTDYWSLWQKMWKECTQTFRKRKPP